MRLIRSLGLAVLAAAACGGKEGTGVTVAFVLFDDGMDVDCKAVPDVTGVRVSVLSSDGLTLEPGYPKPADCAAGRIALPPLAKGSYTLHVEALGTLAGQTDATLFEATRALSEPADASVSLSLQPDVARLSVGWAFEMAGNLAPCHGEVGTVDVIVSAGTAALGTYHGSFPCDRAPPVLPELFAPSSYTIQITANSSVGFPLYGHTETKALTAGPNAYVAVLEPAGGRLILGDVRFVIGPRAAPLGCADPGVRVDGLEARVTTPLGDEPVVESIPCSATRPYALKASRFTTGRPLEVELVAEGVHRFRYADQFLMPPGDKDLGAVTLEAVGTATIALSLTATSACARGGASAYLVALLLHGAPPDSAIGGTLPPNKLPYAVRDLPYGTYDVGVEGLADDQMTVKCRAVGARAITGRRNEWAPFVL